MQRRVASTVQLWSPESVTIEGKGTFLGSVRVRMTMSKRMTILMTIIMSILISVIRRDKIIVLRCLESVGNVGLLLQLEK